MDLSPDVFHGGKLKSHLRDIVLKQLKGAGLQHGEFNSYMVGDLATPRFQKATPMQVVVCLDKDVDKFNQEIGQYLKSLQLNRIGRSLEFAFQNGAINLESHPAVYDIKNGVWFKHFSPKTAQVNPHTPQRGPGWGKTSEFYAVLPKGTSADELSNFLTSKKAPTFVITPAGNRRVEIQCYSQFRDELEKLVNFFVAEPEDPVPPTPTEPQQVQAPFTELAKFRLPEFWPRAGTKFQLGLKPFLEANAGGHQFILDESELPVFTLEGSEKDKNFFLNLIAEYTRYFKQKRNASAFVRDVRFGDLPKGTQDDINQFFTCKANDMLCQYGMVVSELIKKADPHNLDSAKKHISDQSEKDIEKEIYGKKDKYLLLLNDRIIDGHHFLAKADKVHMSRTMKVLDLTPLRFQKRKAQALSNFESDIYQLVGWASMCWEKPEGAGVFDTTEATRAASDFLKRWGQSNHQYAIAVDLDGTLLEYDGFKGDDVFGDPKPGAKEALDRAKAGGVKIILHTCRKNKDAIAAHMQKHQLHFDSINENVPEIESEKPFADLYIDDKAVPFTNWPEISDYVMQAASRKGAQWSFFDQSRFRKAQIFTDRYQALGMDYPDPETMCKGQCEGTGFIPIKQGLRGNGSDEYKEDWQKAEAEEPSDDGWHFLACHDCNGTGNRTAKKSIEPKLKALASKIKHCGDYGRLWWNPKEKEVWWTSADSDDEDFVRHSWGV